MHFADAAPAAPRRRYANRLDLVESQQSRKKGMLSVHRALLSRTTPSAGSASNDARPTAAWTKRVERVGDIRLCWVAAGCLERFSALHPAHPLVFGCPQTAAFVLQMAIVAHLTWGPAYLGCASDVGCGTSTNHGVKRKRILRYAVNIVRRIDTQDGKSKTMQNNRKAMRRRRLRASFARRQFSYQISMRFTNVGS